MPGVTVYHAGTRLDDEGRCRHRRWPRPERHRGGALVLRRLATCAYAAVDKIHFDGMFYRRDIGLRALAEEL